MSKFTTGELAKQCGVTVRTVQYYDTKGLLIPSALSEGGRRLYSEEDLQRLKVICFLRDAGVSINSIAQLLSSEDPGSVIGILLDQQELLLRRDLKEAEEKLDRVAQIRRLMKTTDRFSIESIADVAQIMENRKRMYKIRVAMLTLGLIAEVIETGSLLLWIFRGIWWPFAVGMPVALGIVVWLLVFYFKKVDYICPKCHGVFKPGFWEMFFANHTMTTRKLTCTCCGHKGFCVETCQKEDT